ncbi:MAG: CvpA family protein [Candidatus Omnitrophica bacterium]|nr:CvpA family protein [Candidatus Omnitrophota bacterium]
MRNITDYITIGALLYFFYNGWRKGFLKTLVGPVSLIAGCLIGYFYYQKNQNIAAGLAICIISPFFIHIVASLLLKLWHKTVNSDIPPSKVSRLSGSAFCIVWGGGYLAMMLIVIAIIPLPVEWFERIQNDVLASRSYTLISNRVGDKIPKKFLDIKKIISVLQDSAKLERFESTEEFKALREDGRFKALMDDEETAKQIRNKDYGKLLSNPRMRDIFQDEDLLKKMFALNQRIAEEDEEEESERESTPKIIDIQPK